MESILASLMVANKLQTATTTQTVPPSHLFGRKLILWNNETQHSIQLSNVKVGKYGERARLEYCSMVDSVSYKYNLVIQLQRQLRNIPKLEQELLAIHKHLQELEEKIDALNKFYCNTVTEKFNAKMITEENSQKFCVSEQRSKYRRNNRLEKHRILQEYKTNKRNEIQRRKRVPSSDNNSNTNTQTDTGADTNTNPSSNPMSNTVVANTSVEDTKEEDEQSNENEKSIAIVTNNTPDAAVSESNGNAEQTQGKDTNIDSSIETAMPIDTVTSFSASSEHSTTVVNKTHMHKAEEESTV